MCGACSARVKPDNVYWMASRVPDQKVTTDIAVTLDSSQNSDPTSDPLTSSWVHTSGDMKKNLKQTFNYDPMGRVIYRVTTKSGWYYIDTWSSLSQASYGESDRVFIFQWQPVNDSTGPQEVKRSYTGWIIRERRDASKNIAWVYFAQEGEFTIRIGMKASSAQPHDPSYQEAREPHISVQPSNTYALLHRLTDMSFVGILVAVYVLRSTVLACLFMLSVIVLQAFIHWMLSKLPLPNRDDLEKEIATLLRVARYGGLGGFTIWTAKELLELALHY